MQAAFGVWGNPSSSHQVGREAKEHLELARNKIAAAVGVRITDVVFTSGGSEANTLAIAGNFFNESLPFRIVTTGVEHSSVGDTIKWMQKQGTTTFTIPINRSGQLDLAQLAHLLDQASPQLVSIMAANNETGVIFPIPEISKLCKQWNVPLHVDAVQALGKIPAQFWNCADFISISSHKIYGPKGVGALLLPTQHSLVATHYGGSQEIKRRGGTENLLGIVGFGAATEEIYFLLEAAPKRKELRDLFESTLKSELDEIAIQGETAERIWNTSNIRFFGISNEILLSALDLDGLCVSAGSACSSGSISPSHVLLAMGLNPVEAKECVRFSWGTATTLADVEKSADIVINHVRRIRERRKTRFN